MMEEIKDLTCLCGSRAYRTASKVGNFRLLSCVQCGQSRLYPKPAPNARKPDAGEPPRDPAMERLWRKFAAVIMGEVGCFKRSGSLLDVGCGDGILLDYARSRGFSVRGIDLNESKAAYARTHLKLDVTTGNFMEFDFEKRFDVVVMNHVIEHVEDPVALLSRAREAAAEDGIVVVGTPNVDGWIRTLLGRRWYPYCPGDHVYLYNPKTLARVIGESGLELRKMLLTHNHYGGRAAVLSPLLSLLDVMGRGDNMIAIAGRKDG
ncbi:MAG: class I SAM-dependent methyltransferase [Candidatus Altiarchaeota archaeon]|nr:class I SAM-dependent methyltransferase [Candidatus Altiarchaeota archaeon]